MRGKDIGFDALYYYSRGLAFQDKKQFAEAYQEYRKALDIDKGFAEAEKAMTRLEPFAKQG